MSSVLPVLLALVTAFGLTLAYGWSRGSRSTRHFAFVVGTGMVIAGLAPFAVDALDAGTAGMVLLAGVLLAWGIVAVHLADSTSKGSLTEIAAGIQQASRLDLRVVTSPATPEARAAAESLSALTSALRDTVAKLRRATEAASNDARALRDNAGGVTGELPRRGEKIGAGATSAASVAEAIEVASRDLSTLSASVSRCSSASLEGEASVEEASGGAEKLVALLEQVGACIGEAQGSSRSVARNVESVAAVSEETASAMTQMDASIRAVDRNADETAKLSLQVQRDAESGVDSVNQTIQGIGRIRDYSLEVAGVVGSLGRRAEAIGDVVTVINEVAEQTNLLALNAAIIAAQAGEHGKSFAVVADEIKDLAERTAASTKEIQELVRNVQEETANAVQVIERGKKSVTEGVELSGRAGAALAKILESARRSTHMAQEIARATTEQGKGSQMAAQSIARVAQMLEGIRAEAGGQVKNGEKLTRTAEDLKLVTAEIRAAVRAAARNGKEIVRDAAGISSDAKRIEGALRAKATEAEHIARLLTELGDSSADGKMKQLEAAARELEGHLSVVRGELDRFAI